MLAISSEYRGQGIATMLVRMAIDRMIANGADEIVLETEEENIAAMKLYEGLGFIRSKKLHRYYLNGNEAYRLVLKITLQTRLLDDSESQADPSPATLKSLGGED